MIQGPNIGHTDDPAFQAVEARWAAAREAAWQRFREAAGVIVSSSDKAFRRTVLRRYAREAGRDAGRQLADYCRWAWAGRPREWPPKERHEPA